MKKYAAFVVFCFALAPVYAQISVVGATISSANTSYNVVVITHQQRGQLQLSPAWHLRCTH